MNRHAGCPEICQCRSLQDAWCVMNLEYQQYALTSWRLKIASQVCAKTTHNPLFATKTKGWLQLDRPTATCRRYVHCGLLRWSCYRPDHLKPPEREMLMLTEYMFATLRTFAAARPSVVRGIVARKKAYRSIENAIVHAAAFLEPPMPVTCDTGTSTGGILCSQLIPSSNSTESPFGCPLSPLQTLASCWGVRMRRLVIRSSIQPTASARMLWVGE
ncbi:hypothetical protein J3458_019850 [Metarhizium acridum]|uniref:uncharacterized protein n=1 Tax=Metarhizium acridum TaxID=92637 RepID=UPI001C6C7E19|nr:hypothetical protein J3458_019850 [Metarhizium acridum]